MFKPGDRVRIIKEDEALHKELFEYIGQEVTVIKNPYPDKEFICVSCEGRKQAEEIGLECQWILPECLELV